MQGNRNNIIHAFNWHEVQFIDHFSRYVIEVFHIAFGQDERFNACAVRRQNLFFDTANR